jgi:hypothetical protein
MTSKLPLSQSQIIRKINSQTRKSYKLIDELLAIRPPVLTNKIKKSRYYNVK